MHPGVAEAACHPAMPYPRRADYLISAEPRRCRGCDDLEVTESDDAFETLAVHAGAEPDEMTGAVSPPIYQTTTYAPGRGRIGRAAATSTPAQRTRRASASSERSRRWSAARHGIAFASGSAATAAIAQLARARRRDRRRRRRLRRHVPLPRARPPAERRRRRPVRRPPGRPDSSGRQLTERTRARLVREPIEPDCSRSSTSPPSRGSIRDGLPRRRARPLLVVDNTFASPALQRPLDAGRGHRVPLGDEVPRAATRTRSSGGGHPRRRDRRAAALPAERDGRRCPGRSTASSSCAGCGRCISAWSVTSRTRRAVAAFLAHRDDVERSFYPGWRGPHAHPAGELVGMRSADACRRRDGLVHPAAANGAPPPSAPSRSRGSTRLFTLAESLGGVESLVEIPATMTHASVAGSPSRGRSGAGPPVGRDRGDVDDLERADLRQGALDAAGARERPISRAP